MLRIFECRIRDPSPWCLFVHNPTLFLFHSWGNDSRLTVSVLSTRSLSQLDPCCHSITTMASSLTPAIQAPHGHVSNLINPTDVGYRITITNVVCIVLFMIVVIVRLITRVFLNRSFGHDDCKSRPSLITRIEH
jgi:hypothetical protein